MSHYTVAVISRTGTEEEIEELLAPFDEDLEVESYIYRTKEEIIERGRKNHEEVLKEIQSFEKEKLNNILTNPSYDWYRRILEAKNDEDFYDIEVDTDIVDEDGNEYSTYNPESRWDWWEIGGRWHESLRDYDGNYHDTLRISNWDYNYIYKDMCTFSTYALLTPDGEWLEPGKMGWWGISHADPIDQDKWKRGFTSLIDTFDKDMYVTIVDCHI